MQEPNMKFGTYSPVSNCRGGGSITKFSIFFLRLQFINTPPICEDFEKVRPPLIIANPPNLNESR